MTLTVLANTSLPWIICIVGLLVWFFWPREGKVTEAGRWAFLIGLIVALHTFHN